jgi:hypothetical protein
MPLYTDRQVKIAVNISRNISRERENLILEEAFCAVIVIADKGIKLFKHLSVRASLLHAV